MVLSVDDDGPGIPEDAAEALLERGTRLDEATPGHGIGLAIVKDIARSYGGDVDDLEVGTSVGPGLPSISRPWRARAQTR